MTFDKLLEERSKIEALKLANIPSLKYLAALRGFVTKLDNMQKEELLAHQEIFSLYTEALFELKEYAKCQVLLEDAITQNPEDPTTLALVVKYLSQTEDTTVASQTCVAIGQHAGQLKLQPNELIGYVNVLKKIDIGTSINFLKAYLEATKSPNIKAKFLLAILFAENGAIEKCQGILKQLVPRIGIPRDISTLLFTLKDHLVFDDLVRAILLFENKSFFKELLILLSIKKHQAKDIDYALPLYKFISEQKNLEIDCRLLGAQLNLVKDFDFNLGQALARTIRENYTVKQIRAVPFIDLNLIFHDDQIHSVRRNSFFDFLSMERDWIFLHEQWGSFDRMNVKDLIDDKFNTFLLADIWGIKRPEIYEYGKCYTDLNLRDSVVLKPVAGAVSKGIFIIYNQNRIHDLYGKKWLDSIDQLNARINDYLTMGVVRRDQWFLEELISNDSIATRKARDIKFYCFYGKSLLALESQRDDRVLRCWYDRSGKIVDTGKYSNSAFVGKGIDRSHFELAESISRKLPMPFIRVDFLQANDQIYLGELTPIPSDSETLSSYCDSLMGSALSFANIDLREDLLFNREKFQDFFRLANYIRT